MVTMTGMLPPLTPTVEGAVHARLDSRPSLGHLAGAAPRSTPPKDYAPHPRLRKNWKKADTPPKVLLVYDGIVVAMEV